MPFGIKSISEVFQKKNEEEFAGILGVHIVADDNIIVAKHNQEHNHKTITKSKLESSESSPVPTSLEVSMPLHQPATFPFPSVSLANPSQ